jgi:hypothetical protein
VVFETKCHACSLRADLMNAVMLRVADTIEKSPMWHYAERAGIILYSTYLQQKKKKKIISNTSIRKGCSGEGMRAFSCGPNTPRCVLSFFCGLVTQLLIVYRLMPLLKADVDTTTQLLATEPLTPKDCGIGEHLIHGYPYKFAQQGNLRIYCGGLIIFCINLRRVRKVGEFQKSS